MADTPIYKLVNRKWQELPIKGDDVGIKDKHLKVGHIGDMTKLTVVELQELLQRQEKILANKSFVSKLKDKGAKLKERQQEIQEVLDIVKRNTESPVDAKPEAFLAYEWTGRLENNIKLEENKDHDDMIDPLQLIATHSIEVPLHKKINFNAHEDPSQEILKELEKLDIADSTAGDSQEDYKQKTTKETEDFGTKHLRFIENNEKNLLTKRKKFQPFRPNKPHQLKYHNEQNNPLWMESSATGPVGPRSNNSSRVIPLNESLQLYQKHHQKQKERLQREAVAQLSKIRGLNLDPDSIDYSSDRFINYRDTNISKHILEDSEDEEEDGVHGTLSLVRADQDY